MINELKQLKEEGLKEIQESQTLELLENVQRKYLGRKGKLREYSLKLRELPDKEKPEIGRLINEIKKDLEKIIENKKSEIIRNLKLESEEFFDPTLPGQKILFGHLHPHTQMKYRVAEIFHSMGFEILEGPELENDYYNFESLNIPEGHPARDMWDTFYVKTRTNADRTRTNTDSQCKSASSQCQSVLLRTHTSAMQVRVMEKRKPPLKICVIGKCFRHEATDASHEHTLYQIEGFAVDEQISIANLIYTLKSFLTVLFGQEVKTRLRPSYFPFTEPSFEMDFACLSCGGKGCAACAGTGWVEILGCGMINPKVFEFAGYPKNKYTGFAFGVGLDRLVMMRHKIDDIRWFHSGDLRFLRQF